MNTEEIHVLRGKTGKINEASLSLVMFWLSVKVSLPGFC